MPDGAAERLGACSQGRTYCEQTIARQRGMSMERKRNANGHRENFYSFLYERCRPAARDEQLMSLGLYSPEFLQDFLRNVKMEIC